MNTNYPNSDENSHPPSLRPKDAVACYGIPQNELKQSRLLRDEDEKIKKPVVTNDAMQMKAIALAIRRHQLSNRAGAIAFLEESSESRGQNKTITASIAASRQKRLFEYQSRNEKIQRPPQEDQEERHRRIVERLIHKLTSNSPLDRQKREITTENSQKQGYLAVKDPGRMSQIGKSGSAQDAKSGSMIVPCRARGMPEDHDYRTAYFVIPENIQHGEDLVCSHQSCRDAGIKFCFCSYCRIPAAKRNFSKRHKHFNEDALNEAATNINKRDIVEDQTSPIMNIGYRNRNMNFEEDRISSLSSSSNNNHTDDLEDPSSAVDSTDSDEKNYSISPPKRDDIRRIKGIRKDENSGIKHSSKAENERSYESRDVVLDGGRTFYKDISPPSSSNNPTSNQPLSLLSSSNNNHLSSLTFFSNLDQPKESINRDKSRGTKRSRDAADLQDYFDDIAKEAGLDKHQLRQKRWVEDWHSHLYERPTTNNSEALSNWLLKVISISSPTQFTESDSSSVLNMESEQDSQAKEFPHSNQISNESNASTSTE